MTKNLAASAAALLALTLAVPALAGGAHCRSQSATTASNDEASCHGKTSTSAWAGAWLQRSPSGRMSVADVAKGSPAARSGLKKGDIVLAVNGYDLSNSKDVAKCASKAECSVGKTVAYTVQRGRATKSIKIKLEKMPADATARFADHNATFDPVVAAVVMPAVD
jgi:S1-C subfamily serine protease